MEGQKADENRQKSLFLWKIWQLSFEKGTYFDITGNAAICLGMDGNTIIELFTSYYDFSETSQNASEVFQNSFFFWSSLRPRELKELFTVRSFFKIDAAFFHFSWLLSFRLTAPLTPLPRYLFCFQNPNVFVYIITTLLLIQTRPLRVLVIDHFRNIRWCSW